MLPFVAFQPPAVSLLSWKSRLEVLSVMDVTTVPNLVPIAEKSYA